MSWRLRNNNNQESTATIPSSEQQQQQQQHSSWKSPSSSTARRVQLSFKKGSSSLLRRRRRPGVLKSPCLEEETAAAAAAEVLLDDNNNNNHHVVLTETIDDALRSLYYCINSSSSSSYSSSQTTTTTTLWERTTSCNNHDSVVTFPSTTTPSSSYVPTTEPDWLLDGYYGNDDDDNDDEWRQEAAASYALLQELHQASSSSLDYLETLLREHNVQQALVPEEEDSNEDEDEVEFGEFQSAPPTPDTTNKDESSSSLTETTAAEEGEEEEDDDLESKSSSEPITKKQTTTQTSSCQRRRRQEDGDDPTEDDDLSTSSNNHSDEEEEEEDDDHTPTLVRRVDQILLQQSATTTTTTPAATPAREKTPPTPQLIERAEQVLRQAATAAAAASTADFDEESSSRRRLPKKEEEEEEKKQERWDDDDDKCCSKDDVTPTNHVDVVLPGSILDSPSKKNALTKPQTQTTSSAPSLPSNETAKHDRQSSDPTQLSLSFVVCENNRHNKNDGDDNSMVQQRRRRISLQLPLDDLSSPSARFTRRSQLRYQQQQQDDDDDDDDVVQVNKRTQSLQLEPPSFADDDDDDDDLLNNLLSTYYAAQFSDLDDTVQVLESLPWHYLREQYEPPDSKHDNTTTTTTTIESYYNNQYYYETSELAMWDESMTLKLCELDAALEGVHRRLLNDIQPHKAGIGRANQVMHEWEQNLRLAFMYLDRSKQAIDEAMGVDDDDDEASGLVGPSVLLQTWQQQDDYRELCAVLEELALVFEKEQDLLKRIDSFDTRESDALNEYFAVMKLSSELERTVCQGRLSDMKCLDSLRTRLGATSRHFWGRLLELSESVVMRCCRKLSFFDWIEYERLVKAIVDLHSNAFAEDDDVHLAHDWSESIFKALCHEADTALAVALLEPTDASESEFAKELNLLGYEVEQDWGDAAKLRTLTHNAVTIRFDFESRANYLPRVFHKLCTSLTDVLHAHFLFTQWHIAPFDDSGRNYNTLHEICEKDCICDDVELASIFTKLRDSRAALWDHCQGVIVRCLDEYLNFAARPNLFEHGQNEVDDSVWANDLSCLHDVLILTEKFLSLKSSFFGGELEKGYGLSSLKDSRNFDSSLYDKLSDVFRRHLRSVHVEAMNAMGRKLATESWILTSLKLPKEHDLNADSKSSVDTLFFGALKVAISNLRVPKRARWGDITEENISTHHFAQFPCNGNPLVRWAVDKGDDFAEIEATASEDSTESHLKRRAPLHDMLDSVITQNLDKRLPPVAPECVAIDLVEWFSRLIVIIEKLPLIAEDVSAVFANLCDLYFTTVLRLVCGSSKNERIVLGVDLPSPYLSVRNETRSPAASRPPGSPLFSFRNKGGKFSKSQAYRPSPIVPVWLDAEICAPLHRDASILVVRRFIERAQNSLQDIVNLDKVSSWLVDPSYSADTEEHACRVAQVLEKRETAIWSCLVVAAFADITCSVASSSLETTFLRGGRFADDLTPLKSYVGTILEMTPTLASAASQVSCIRAISGTEVVKEIIKVGAAWEECKLNEHPNDYVDELCDRIALLWGFLSVSGKLPPVVRKSTWESLLSAAYLSLLEGFARIPFCSTEGRALMTLDLASLSAGINTSSIIDRLERRSLVASAPPSVEPERSMRYVDTYIKVFYYPREDVLHWIDKNYKDYQMNHVLALAKIAVGSPEQNSETLLAKVMVDRVKGLYETNEEKGGDASNRQLSNGAVVTSV